MKKALVIYQSITGNTEKVAKSICQGLHDGGVQVVCRTINEGVEENFYDYDLVCFGAPSYNWHVTKPAEEYLKSKFQQYKKENRILPGAPEIPGKHALVFCTYSGPHTGIREAVPTGLYIGQFFEHFGFHVEDKWYVLSEFVGSEEFNTLGRMGNIKGLPDERELERRAQCAQNLSKRLFVNE
ncbi:MAG: flavodoxin domain-containing protein [Muricomes sp.]